MSSIRLCRITLILVLVLAESMRSKFIHTRESKVQLLDVKCVKRTGAVLVDRSRKRICSAIGGDWDITCVQDAGVVGRSACWRRR